MSTARIAIVHAAFFRLLALGRKFTVIFSYIVTTVYPTIICESDSAKLLSKFGIESNAVWILGIVGCTYNWNIIPVIRPVIMLATSCTGFIAIYLV